MNEQEIKTKRKLLSDKAYALKELMECGDLTYDEYSQEIAKIQIERRKLKNANVIDAEVVSVDEPSNGGGMEDGPRHLPAVIPAQPADSNAKPGRDWSKSSVPERRCKAHRKNGEQCKNAAIKGSTVCRYHGGASKHVKMAARARIENATDMMAKALLGMAIDPDVSDAVKLSAIKDALDRGGLKAPETVVLSAGQQSGFEEIFDDISTMTRAESRRARGIEDADLNPIEPQSNHPPAPASPNTGAECRARNNVGYQRDSNTRNDYSIQSDGAPCCGPAAPLADDGPIPSPSHRQGRDRSPQSRTGPHITGDDAMRIANVVNAATGALRALPPGRG